MENETNRDIFWRKVRQAFVSELLKFSRKTEVEEAGLVANIYRVGAIIRIDIPIKHFVEGGKQVTL